MKLSGIFNYELNNRKKSLQEKARALLIGFFALMFLLTILSRIGNGIIIPKVTAVSPDSMSIDHSIQVDGQILARRDVAVSTAENIRIASIDVDEGAVVRKGDILFQLDLTDLDKKIAAAKDALTRAELQQMDAESGKAIEAQNRQKAIRRAEEDYNAAAAEADRNVQRALDALNEAKTKLDAYKEGGPDSDVLSSLDADYEGKKKAYEDAVSNKERILRAAQRALEDASNPAPFDHSGEIAAMDIEAMQENIERLEALKNSNGEITASADGTVIRLNIGVGGQTTGGTDVVLTDASANENVIISTVGNIRIISVDVAEGTAIKKGDILFRLDLSDLDIKIADAKDALARAELQAQDAVSRDAVEAQNRQKAIIRAVEDYNTAVIDTGKSVQSALDAMNEAKAKLDEYKKNGGPDPDVLSALEADYEGKKRSYEDALASKESILRAAQRALEDANSPVPSDHSGEIAAMDMEIMQENIEKLEALRRDNGQVLAPTDGTVIGLNIAMGGMTSGGTDMVLSDASSGFSFKAEIDEADAKYLSKGDAAALYFNNGNSRLEDLRIDAIYPSVNGDGRYNISVNIPAGSGNPGMSASLGIDIQSMRYETCLPLEALHIDGDKSYVLMITEKDTVLGSEVTAERIDVNIEDKNDTYAAISGKFAPDQKFISETNKPIQSGDRVRLVE